MAFGRKISQLCEPMMVVVCLCNLLVACNQERPKEWHGSVEIREGVRYVSNPVQPILPDVRVPKDRLITSFGHRESKDGFLLVYPMAISVNNNGEIAIADNRLAKVFLFDQHGQFILAHGNKKGQGPREIGATFNIHLDDDRTVYLADRLNHRLQIFKPNGNVKIHKLNITASIRGSAWHQDTGAIYLLTPVGDKQITRLAADYTSEFAFREPEITGNETNDLIETVLSITTAFSGELILTFGLKPVFELYTPTGKLATVVHYHPLYDLQTRKVGSSSHDGGHDMYSVAYTCRSITTDENGIIYLLSQTDEEGTQNVLLCFDKDGRFLQKIWLPQISYHRLAINNGKLYLLTYPRYALPRCEIYPLPDVQERVNSAK